MTQDFQTEDEAEFYEAVLYWVTRQLGVTGRAIGFSITHNFREGWFLVWVRPLFNSVFFFVLWSHSRVELEGRLNLRVRKRVCGVGRGTMRVGSSSRVNVGAWIPSSDAIKNSSAEFGNFRQPASISCIFHPLLPNGTDTIGCEMCPMADSCAGVNCIRRSDGKGLTCYPPP